MLSEAEWLKEQGWAVEIAATCFSGFEHFADRARHVDIDVSTLDFPLFMENWRWRYPNVLRAMIRARRLKRRFSADVIHVPFAWTEQGLSTLWLAAHIGQRCVISVHNVFPPWQMTDWHRKRLQRAFSRVAGIYGVSVAATDAYERIFGELIPRRALVTTVPNFVDCDRFVPDPAARRITRHELGIPEDALVIVVLGRISEQKNPHLIMEAFATLRARCRNQDPWLLFIGGGELEDAVWADANARDVSARVRVTGFVDDPHSYLVAGDVHLLASDREGFGMATIEAMACGLPVIATDTAASREILTDSGAGLLVETGNVSSIVDGLQQLLIDEGERKRRAQKARGEALAHYGKAQWADRIAAFYAESLTGGR